MRRAAYALLGFCVSADRGVFGSVALGDLVALALLGRGPGRTVDRAPRVLGHEVGNCLRVIARHDLLRHDGAGEAAVSDRVQDGLGGLSPLVQIRALVEHYAVRGAERTGGLKRVAACAPLGEELSAAQILFGLDVDLAATGTENEGRRYSGGDCENEAHRGGIILFRVTVNPPSPDEFRAAMALVPTPVTVVTAPGDGERAGATASAVASLSLDPPLMLVCLDHRSRTLGALRAAGSFAVNVLSAASESEARKFATTAPHAEKWEGVPATEHAGVPVLDDALLWVVCELRDLLDGGDHTIVTGSVVELGTAEGAPLIFHDGEYRAL
jgi:flavin reductase (DIM6/NTAB) family NADH-FMN oxidoreductase RutF